MDPGPLARSMVISRYNSKRTPDSNCMCNMGTILGPLPGSGLVRQCSSSPYSRYSTLKRQKLVKMVQSTHQLAEIDLSCYSGHCSFCIGAATTAAAKGIDVDTIRTR